MKSICDSFSNEFRISACLVLTPSLVLTAKMTHFAIDFISSHLDPNGILFASLALIYQSSEKIRFQGDFFFHTINTSKIIISDTTFMVGFSTFGQINGYF